MALEPETDSVASLSTGACCACLPLRRSRGKISARKTDLTNSTKPLPITEPILIQWRSRPQDRHLRSKTLPGAPGGSILGPRTKDLASRGPRNLRSRGTLPPPKKPYMWAASVGRCVVLVVRLRPGNGWDLTAISHTHKNGMAFEHG